MKLLAFAASHRTESLNLKLVALAGKHARSLGADVSLINYSELDMPVYDDSISPNPPKESLKLAKKCSDVDGIMIALPEYNWSFPGSLKNIIDWTSKSAPAALAGKTAFIMSATTGSRGGIVGLEQFKTPLEAVGIYVFNKVFPLPYAQHAFGPQGELTDEKKQELFFGQIKDYISYTKKLSSN